MIYLLTYSDYITSLFDKVRAVICLKQISVEGNGHCQIGKPTSQHTRKSVIVQTLNENWKWNCLQHRQHRQQQLLKQFHNEQLPGGQIRPWPHRSWQWSLPPLEGTKPNDSTVNLSKSKDFGPPFIDVGSIPHQNIKKVDD